MLLQAGDINIGAFDDFEALIPLAKRYGAWVHIDGVCNWRTSAEDVERSINSVAQVLGAPPREPAKTIS